MVNLSWKGRARITALLHTFAIATGRGRHWQVPTFSNREQNVSAYARQLQAAATCTPRPPRAASQLPADSEPPPSPMVSSRRPRCSIAAAVQGLGLLALLSAVSCRGALATPPTSLRLPSVLSDDMVMAASPRVGAHRRSAIISTPVYEWTPPQTGTVHRTVHRFPINTIGRRFLRDVLPWIGAGCKSPLRA